MTRHQFAVATGGGIKWVLNSAALLRRRIRYTHDDARWWGLVRVLAESLGLPLKPAAEAATSSLRDGETTPITDLSGSAFLRVDLNRYQSTFLANLSRALVLETPRQRGRPPRAAEGGAISSAASYGVDISLVQAALARTPAQRLAMLESNARMIRAMRKRGK